MKKTLLAAALVAAAASAQAGTKLYGHVAYTANFGDDSSIPEGRDYEFNRYGFSESRFGFSFSKKAGGVNWLALQEYGLAEGSGGIGNTRRQAFGLSGGFGKILFGQYNDVGDGVLHADLAGTGLVDPMSSSSAGVAGNVTNYGDENTAADNVTVQSRNGFDPGRGEALRYWTPKLGGVATIGAQLEENEAFELALKLNTAGFRVYGFFNDGGDENEGAIYDNRFGVLLGYKFPFGLSLTGVYSESEDLNGESIEHSAVKLGYALGKHKLSLKYQTAEGFNDNDTTDATVDDDRRQEPEETVLAWNFSPAKGVNLFAAIKSAEDNRVDADGTSFGVGGRVKF